MLTKYQNGLGIDNKLKLATGGTAKYFLADHLGSTVGLTDSSGNITSSAAYDSFGNSTNNLTTRYQYTGREFDNFTGLQYSRARWYDANLGRFISEDPIGFRGGDVDLFGYVQNSPIDYVDPFGNERYPTSFYQGDYDSLRTPGLEGFGNSIDRSGFFDETYNKAAPAGNYCSCELDNPEIARMKQLFGKEVNNMTNFSQRRENGLINNIQSTMQIFLINGSPVNPAFGLENRLYGCGEQSEELNKKLRDQLDNKWKLETRSGYFYGFPHQFSVATSSDPNDPVVILDPWRNHFETRRR